jgi:hypothetical protein
MGTSLAITPASGGQQLYSKRRIPSVRSAVPSVTNPLPCVKKKRANRSQMKQNKSPVVYITSLVCMCTSYAPPHWPLAIGRSHQRSARTLRESLFTEISYVSWHQTEGRLRQTWHSQFPCLNKLVIEFNHRL